MLESLLVLIDLYTWLFCCRCCSLSSLCDMNQVALYESQEPDDDITTTAAQDALDEAVFHSVQKLEK